LVQNAEIHHRQHCVHIIAAVAKGSTTSQLRDKNRIRFEIIHRDMSPQNIMVKVLKAK